MNSRIRTFEDLVVWQKAIAFVKRVYLITAEGDFRRDFGLRDQLRRAAVSVPTNIAEGFERGRSAEFHQFLSVAKASCAEVRAQLYVALDAGYLSTSVFDGLMAQATEVGLIIGGLRLSVERRRNAPHR